ncbi:ThiF family adenylyltransferase [Streptomyces sp. NPDC007088]|uniref:ThiF family adenylyltransferase n=1 Tax=Streptomyces sp. NPDC007088 TaxID=3364773 RepID=UPI00369211C0
MEVTAGAAAPFGHPALKPALRQGWRDLNNTQFGVTEARAVLLGPLDLATSAFLRLLDGTRGLPLLYAEAARAGLSEGYVNRLLDGLVRAGLLEDATGGGEGVARLREDSALVERLRPDLASLSLLDPRPCGALEALEARARARVLVRGAGRVGASVAALLSGAGVGRVEVMDGGRVDPGDVSPGGLPSTAVGQRRTEAARRLVREVGPARGRRQAPPDGPAVGGVPGQGGAQDGAGIGRAAGLREPDRYSLVVLAPRDGLAVHAPDPATAQPFLASGTPHLYAGVIETSAVVGPLVLPGATGCARCLDLGRADRDPGWPRLLAQWRSGRAHRAEAADVTLAAAAAGLAAAHALSFLDGRLPASTGARWEAALPGADWRSCSLPPHPRCGCGADRAARVDQEPEADRRARTGHADQAPRTPHTKQAARAAHGDQAAQTVHAARAGERLGSRKRGGREEPSGSRVRGDTMAG